VWNRRRVTEYARLADDLACVLASEPSGLSGNELVLRVGRRRADVLANLRSNPRFVLLGRTNARRWRLVDEEPLQTDEEPPSALGRAVERLDAVEAHTDPMERRNRAVR